MERYAEKNKVAWEYDAYNFWVSQVGHPSERAKKVLENPRAMLGKYSDYFHDVNGIKVANICGSCGKKAVPLAILGASVTVFDISEDNIRYACETAEAAGTGIEYIVGDVMDINMSIYCEYFDIVFMEGGVLHYFHDINKFMRIIISVLKNNGKLICSDFHPLHKILDVNGLGGSSSFNPDADYFSADIIQCEMAHAKLYETEKRESFPKCSIRRYTISEIINAVISSGFTLSSFDEHPGWSNIKLPGEFTLVADKKF